MKSVNKAELQLQYDEYVVPALSRWKSNAKTDNSDFAFLLWATDLVLEDFSLTNDEILEACSLDGKWDLKIDAGYIDESERIIYLIQSKHYNPTKAAGEAPFLEAWESLELLSNPKLVGKSTNRYTKEFYIEFTEAIKKQYGIVLCVVTSARILDNYTDYMVAKPKTRTVQIGKDNYEISTKFVSYGLPELIDMERQGEQKQSIKPREPVTLNLQQGWYCVPMGQCGKQPYDCLYTTISAEELIPIRKKIGTDDLYTMNFRGPLGDRITVNQEIFTTIKSLPNLFHVLNNGLVSRLTVNEHFLHNFSR